MGAYCAYENNEDYSQTYGYLYNWYTVNDSRNIAPEGWHVPSDEEWMELEMQLGMSQSDANSQGVRGEKENVGGKLKKANTNLWEYPNEFWKLELALVIKRPFWLSWWRRCLLLSVFYRCKNLPVHGWINWGCAM